MLELRTLAYFVAACRAESFAEAADELGVAASTLSTALNGLGQILGLALFRRANNKLYPTAAARALMRAAEPLLIAETFARRFVAAPAANQCTRLIVDIGLSFTVGGISRALRVAIDKMAAERPDVFVDLRWRDEKDSPHVEPLRLEGVAFARSELTIGLGPEGDGLVEDEATLLLDPWVFALRLPSGTQNPPSLAGLGPIVVPALAAPLIEQASRYFTRRGITGVRFLADHPGDLPRTIVDYPDATLFVPRTLVSPRLGLSHVALVMPEQPLAMRIVARAAAPDALTASFIRHLKQALRSDAVCRPDRPAISLRQIQYFNKVHQLRRVSAAARAANVSQPALSEQLHKLEAALGGLLFQRRDDGVIPTAAGDRFAQFAPSLEAGFRGLSSMELGAAPPPSRSIVAGILPSVNQHGFLVNRITEALVELQARHPALRPVIREAPNGTLQDWVIRGLVGVAIVETALPHMPRLPLGSSEELAAIAHSRHRLLPPGPVTLADLTSRKLALPTHRFGLRQLLEAAAEERGLKIQPYMEIDALPMAVAMLASLPVCTVLPPSAVAGEIASGALVAHPIVEPTIARRLYVIYSGERSLSEPELYLVEALRKKLAAPEAQR